jgi:predicted RNase H-like nuclease (RuvC/YqgF family)
MTNKLEKPVDWEKLSKNLQKALEKEIDESEKHRKWCLEWRTKYDQLEEDHKKEVDRLNTESNNLFIRCHKLKGIIEYLEDKLGNNPIRGN